MGARVCKARADHACALRAAVRQLRGRSANRPRHSEDNSHKESFFRSPKAERREGSVSPQRDQ